MSTEEQMAHEEMASEISRLVVQVQALEAQLKDSRAQASWLRSTVNSMRSKAEESMRVAASVGCSGLVNLVHAERDALSGKMR